jgi:hypothetical protein
LNIIPSTPLGEGERGRERERWIGRKNKREEGNKEK